ncbi:MAG: ABC transporter substrate-binding protein [Acidimicrobiales bacterium]|nr:ABC transporter substrate-binding protein [Acidimicrobiales bacterium]
MRTRVLAGLVALVLVAAACGGHSDVEDETAEGAGGGGGDSSSTTAGVDAPAPGVFGDMAEPVCGPGDASGSTDQGVTDDAIKVGTLADPGNTIIPGLLQELFDASEAFVAWCNEAGGINGRQLELTTRDTKLVEVQQRITEACAEDFALVGGGTALDSTIVQARVDCGLVDFPAFLNDAVAQGAELKIQAANPFYPDYLNVGIYNLAAQQFPDDITSFGFLAADLNSTGRPIEERLPEVLEADYGYDVVYLATTPPPPATVDNWRPYVEAASAAGATMFEYRGTPEYTVPLMNTMVEVGYAPTAMLQQGNHYAKQFIEGNDALGEIPTYVEIGIFPFEDAAENPPTQQFLDLMDDTVPGWSEDPALLGVYSWSSWLLFAQAAKQCGSELTRECVLEKATAITQWDGGGLHAPVDPDPTEPKGPACVIVMKATPDGFVMDTEFTKPNEGPYNCSDTNRAEVPR